MKTSDKLPWLIGLLVAAIVTKKYFEKKKLSYQAPGVTPEQKAANIRAQMQTAFESGDTTKYLSLQEQLELTELETGL